ncbi:unnamed protein product [Effrenium voratum]|uniref:Nucleotide-diphospho-sugar transferase domain-containing protein n=1 Tax=Effrenium voratum TaxID=2562239 RepID=A0AA36JNX9_9DINO|nr:unnamed protein product [Effrenium voratum]
MSRLLRSEGRLLLVGLSVAGSCEPSWLCASEQLPDFDCLGDPRAQRILEAARGLRASLEQLAREGPGDVFRESLPVLEWKEAVYRDDVLAEECPYALALLRFLRWCQSHVDAHSSDSDRFEIFEVLFQSPYLLTPGEVFPTFVNSRFVKEMWPLVAAIAPLVARKAGPDDELGAQLRCQSTEVNWTDYLERLQSKAPDALVWFDLPGVAAFEELFRRNMPEKFLDCPLGVLVSLLEKLLVMQEFYTEGYGLVAAEIAAAFDGLQQLAHHLGRSTLDLLFLSPWPFWDHLAHLHERGSRRLRYDLDFYPWEILSNPGSPSVRRWLRNRPSQTMRSLLLALEEISSSEAFNQILLCTLLWGGRLAGYLPAALQRMEALGFLHQYLIFCGGEACEVCRGSHRWPSLCVGMQQFALFSKHAMIAAIVNQGFDLLYLDFDTIVMQDPFPRLARDAEMLVSRDFGSECLNTGVIYVKACPSTADFFHRLLLWLWHHPFEFSQKAFAGLLGQEQLAAEPSPLQRRLLAPRAALQAPRWALLDPINEFVTSKVYSTHLPGVHFEGWTGELSQIVVFHFLDGGGVVDPTRSSFPIPSSTSLTRRLCTSRTQRSRRSCFGAAMRRCHVSY